MIPNAIVICGASSSGKTSLARSLQELLLPDVWLTFAVDDIIYRLPPSVLHRCNHENDWEGVDGSAIFEGAAGSLRALLDAGNRVIFDVVVSNSKDADCIQAALTGVETFTVELKCDLAILEQRASGRGDRTIEETQRSSRSSRTHANSDFTCDTSGHTPNQLASMVLAAINGLHPSKQREDAPSDGDKHRV